MACRPTPATPPEPGSILQALGQHDDDLLTGGADLSAIDEQDGTAIASHIFGDQEDEVVNRLGGLPAVGGSGPGGDLVRKLLPILAPMVLSWLANRVLKGGGGARRRHPRRPADTCTVAARWRRAARPGSLDDLLRDVLGSAAGSAGAGSARLRRWRVAGRASTPAASSATCSAASSAAAAADARSRQRVLRWSARQPSEHPTRGRRPPTREREQQAHDEHHAPRPRRPTTRCRPGMPR